MEDLVCDIEYGDYSKAAGFTLISVRDSRKSTLEMLKLSASIINIKKWTTELMHHRGSTKCTAPVIGEVR